MSDWERKVYEYSLRSGGIVTVFIGTHPFYFLSDPNDSLQVANTCLSKPYVYNFAKELYNNGLNTAEESTWKRHRKLLNPAFNIQILNSLLDVFNDQAQRLVAQLATETGKNDIDLETHLSNHFIKTTCHTTLGLSPDDGAIIKDYASATQELYSIYLQRAIKFWLHLQCIFNRCSLKKKHDVLVRTLKDISDEVIYKRKLQIKQDNKKLPKSCDQNSDKFRPLLDRMLDFTGTEDEFADDDIRDHVNTMVGAAYSTSAKSILFTLILVGCHDDVQSKLFKELYEVLGDEGRNLNKFDLQKLVYLEAVIKESLRLYPPVPRVARLNQSEVKLKNFTLRAGSTSVISLHAINRHPMWGADADLFRPERWLDPASLPDNPNAFASFSLGKRNCIGKIQAMMMMKISLAHILLKYSITSTSAELKTQYDLLQSPAMGYKINIQLRR
ncbi:cytochrome P450 4C1-like [Trichoplusia ni]|uniref:Cytochrome P450 4C1-like n=1 Tax=Trichoplusia ni TaxID=7111 RepID=A0A7E5VM54_TRINI|nr:cytochrome P450 4C1-like [Trichoplusia ni]